MSTIRFLSILAITLISMQSLALAHVTLNYPASRGFDENKEPTAPCGGFDTVSTQRVQMPLKGSFIEINSGHTSYSYIVNSLANNNPTTADFVSSNLVAVAQGTRSYPQAACLPITFADNVKANTNVTLQIVYNGGDGLLYQCVDAILVESTSDFNSSMCSNADGSATGLNSASAPSSSATVNNSSTNNGSSLKMATGLILLVAACISLLLA